MTTPQVAPAATVPPPRERWPDLPPHTEAGQMLTDLILTTFRLNGRLMDVAQEMAAKAGSPPHGGKSSEAYWTSRAASPRLGGSWV